VLSDKLTGAGVPSPVASKLLGAQEYVSQGVAPVAPGTPAPLAQAIASGSQAAFMSGLHVALVVAAVLAFAGAAVAPLIRRGASPVESAVAT
jgi:hypothetical protein